MKRSHESAIFENGSATDDGGTSVMFNNMYCETRRIQFAIFDDLLYCETIAKHCNLQSPVYSTRVRKFVFAGKILISQLQKNIDLET